MDEIFNVSLAPLFLTADYPIFGYGIWKTSTEFILFEIDETPIWDIVNSLN